MAPLDIGNKAAKQIQDSRKSPLNEPSFPSTRDRLALIQEMTTPDVSGSSSARFDTNGLQTQLGQPVRLLEGGTLHSEIVKQNLDFSYTYRIRGANPDNPGNPRAFEDSNSIELTVSQDRSSVKVKVPYNITPEFSDKILDFLKKRGVDVQGVTELQQFNEYTFKVDPANSNKPEPNEIGALVNQPRMKFDGKGFPQTPEEGPVKLNQKDPITIERLTIPRDIVQEFRIVGKGNGKYDDFFSSYADLKMVGGQVFVTFQNQFPGNQPNPQFVRDVCNELARRGLDIKPDLSSMKQVLNLNGESMGYRLTTQTKPDYNSTHIQKP